LLCKSESILEKGGDNDRSADLGGVGTDDSSICGGTTSHCEVEVKGGEGGGEKELGEELLESNRE